VVDIVKFHIDHNYYVSIKSIPDTIGFTALFPKNIFARMPELHRTYIICNDGESLEVFDRVESKRCKSTVIDATKFSSRVFILEDVLLKTIAYKMSQKLLVIEGTTSKNILDLLPLQLNDADTALEQELCIKFRDLVLGRIDRNIRYDLAPSYDMLVKFFEKGGL
jgi:hypothetical protein